MTDFFTALEAELQAAGGRRPRLPLGLSQALAALAAATLVALAVIVTLAVRGGGPGDAGRAVAAPKPDPVGTVIPRGEGNPPRGRRAIVVANGVAPISGPWQMEVNRTRGQRDTSGAIMWHRGYCLVMNLLDPPADLGGGRSGFCGAPRSLGFRKTPGFSRAQGGYRSKPPQKSKEVLVWGRVPDRAQAVVVTAPGGTQLVVKPTDGPKSFPGRFYAIPVPPDLPGARINWVDSEGKPGSRGIALLPPITH